MNVASIQNDFAENNLWRNLSCNWIWGAVLFFLLLADVYERGIVECSSTCLSAHSNSAAAADVRYSKTPDSTGFKTSTPAKSASEKA